ncbi:lactonase family protein [Pigmentiphaga soli]|uniref:Lactonase family protein n=1 Tax=Pigmentiphaga soli TaxID=1007095 RepID=A0ABP8H3K3_9BURK
MEQILRIQGHATAGRRGTQHGIRLLAGGFTAPKREGRARGASLLEIGADGRCVALAEVAMSNPAWFAVHPARRTVYVGHADEAYVSALALDADEGRLELESTLATGGSSTLHLACDPGGDTLLVANFGSGQVSMIGLSAVGAMQELTGVVSLSAPPGPLPSQTGSQPHQISFSPDGRFVLVPDRGCDVIWICAFDARAGAIEVAGRAEAPPAAGPRHIAWHPFLPIAYVVHELDSSVGVYEWSARQARLGRLAVRSALPPRYQDRNIGAAICIAPDGRHLYVSNRGQDAVAVFAVAPDGLDLQPQGWTAEAGRSPRFMQISGDGSSLWVAAHGSDDIRRFDVDRDSGALREALRLRSPSPACVALL